MTTEDFEAGLVSGRVTSLEKEMAEHKDFTHKRFEDIIRVQASVQKTIWMIIGAFTIIVFLPEIKNFFGS